jgi:8-oxo-dGTP pyrophosphatase MutT (NUDIX family)
MQSPTNVYGAICISPEGKVLLVQNKYGEKWSFPKGHIEKGETMIQCATRELKEEAGISAPNVYQSCLMLINGVYFVYMMNENQSSQKLKVEDTSEIGNAAWFPLTKLPEPLNVDLAMFKNLIESMQTSTVMKQQLQLFLNHINSPNSHKRLNKWRQNLYNKWELQKAEKKKLLTATM